MDDREHPRDSRRVRLAADREEKIRAFGPRTYFEGFGDFGVRAGSYRGRWFDEKFQKSADEQTRAERLWDSVRAEEIKSKCLGKTGEISEEKKAATQVSPL